MSYDFKLTKYFGALKPVTWYISACFRCDIQSEKAPKEQMFTSMLQQYIT